ncbi:expressed protein [Echinococcus multilocularis]|uniref:Expressed protein n=1 Tax=Echinococcus multilocularis TaxID=6211 RepID=A0A068YHJ4_ECHMU|nr:expressed protein [Echinococcus multilocularis]
MHFDWPPFFGHPFILFTISPKAASVSCGRCAMLMFRPLYSSWEESRVVGVGRAWFSRFFSLALSISPFLSC